MLDLNPRVVRRPESLPLSARMHKKLGHTRSTTLLLLSLLTFSGCDGCRQEQEPGGDPPPSITEPWSPSAEEVSRHNEAAAWMGQFDYATARDLFAELSAAHPDWDEVQVDLAIATLNRQLSGDSLLAQELLGKIIENNPNNLRAYYCLGILYLDGGDPTRALELFQRVAEADPTDGYAAYYTGQCLSQLGQPAEALKWFEKAIAIDPYLRSAQYGAFQACLRLGKQDEALHFRDLFQKLENNPQARVAEIKYTRMGPKAEVSSITAASSEVTAPTGALFAPSKALPGVERSLQASTNGPPNVTVCDTNQDGRIDLFIAGLSSDESHTNLLLLADESGFRIDDANPLSLVDQVNAAAWGDFNNDGTTDVYLLRNGPNQLWQQASDGQWSNVTDTSGTAGEAINSRDGLFFDADHDGDLDLFVVNDGPNELFNNNLDGTFQPIASERNIAGDADSREIIVADFDTDRDVDLIVINEGQPNEAYRNDLLWSYEPANGFDAFRSAPLSAGVALDREADGQLEILTLGVGGMQWWTWDGSSWVANSFGGDEVKFAPPLAAADINGDGQPEIVVSTADDWRVLDLMTAETLTRHDHAGSWRLANLSLNQGPSLIGINASHQPLLWSPGPGRFPFITLQFTGKEDKGEQMRSNRSGIGVQGALRIGSAWFAFDTFRTETGPGQSLQPLTLGTGPVAKIDYVKMTWPDGVFQTELGLNSGERHLIEEDQRQVASCPVVFAWNGKEHQFVTDVLGVAGIGFNVGFGQYGEPRPWENLLLPENLLKPRNGFFEIKLGEPMEEACYLDAARLVRYDLPPDWQMVIDERFHILGPPPTGQPIFFRQEFQPIEARNDRGKDVMHELQEADFIAAPPGEIDRRFLGRTAPHSLELTFDTELNKPHLYLLMDGWIEYPYSQTMFAAWQAKAAYEAPTIEAQDANGNWQTVVEQFGYMAGMPRRAVVPLPVERIPNDCRRLRIRTNVEIFWDRLAIIIAEANDQILLTSLPLADAIVQEVGFAKRTNYPQRRPHYDYAQRAPLWDTRHLRGNYTNFGEATELVDNIDDALAIFGPGEEIELRFKDDESNLPAKGSRHYVLELNGWCKDMDLYTRDAETLAPLPTLEAGSDNPQRNELHKKFNQRYRAGF